MNMKKPKVLTLEYTSLQRQKPVDVNARFKSFWLRKFAIQQSLRIVTYIAHYKCHSFKNETRWNTLHIIEISNGDNNAYLLSLRTGHRENLPLSL